MDNWILDQLVNIIQKYDEVIKTFFLKVCPLIMNKRHTKF